MTHDGYFDLTDFVRESNRIEGILREPTQLELNAHDAMLTLPELRVGDIETFVAICAGKRHVLRDRAGLNVRVGNHIAPAGGPAIRLRLQDLLGAINVYGRSTFHPWRAHQDYETLHPFTDGNGRSGRAIWLWQMGGIERAPLGFLHTFYYQTLEHGSGRSPNPRDGG